MSRDTYLIVSVMFIIVKGWKWSRSPILRHEEG
jgi:hypothetical protein